MKWWIASVSAAILVSAIAPRAPGAEGAEGAPKLVLETGGFTTAITSARTTLNTGVVEP